MTFLKYSKSDPLSPQYPLPIILDNIQYSSPSESPDVKKALLIKYKQNLELRKQLKDTYPHSLVGKYSDLLEQVRLLVIEHDKIIQEETEIGNNCVIPKGKYTVILPDMDDIYWVERDIYLLQKIGTGQGFDTYKEIQTTYGRQKYMTIYSMDGLYRIYMRDGSAILVGKNITNEVKEFFESFLER